MEYNFRDIEKKWQKKWAENGVYRVSNDSDKPKFYVLDMFPYPSGAGLHVGHPLGYIASDIYARYKRLKGFNVLHPMGYDAFGLPAEQYAIEHGVHPAVSTEKNINTFRKQLDNIGFSFDWSRELRTSDPKYYKWTQWIFLKLFKSWYNRNTNKTESIDELIKIFEKEGNKLVHSPQPTVKSFTADEWKSFDAKTQQTILMEYRIAYCGFGEVNWCESLGTVLANDEVVNGVSERGGYPVVKKKLRQWYLRITEYAERLLEGLEKVEFSDAMKEMQSNWIGKSEGAEIKFYLTPSPSPQVERGALLQKIKEHLKESTSYEKTVGSKISPSPPVEKGLGVEVFTTRPDTIFGVDFLVLAPEHDLVSKITTPGQKQAVEEYITYVKSRSERERMAEKKITGVFTGAYAIHPFNGKQIPIWISEYVLIGYGTGAIMGVPSGDERDHKFAQHFNIPITNIFGEEYNGEEAITSKDAVLHNSDFLDGMMYDKAFEVVMKELEEEGMCKRKINYKMRDAAFSRQRYWGEPFPIVWKDGIAYPLDESELPLELPHVESYKPGPEGEGPLANIPEWTLIPSPSPRVEKGNDAASALKYSVSSPVQYELAKQMRKEFTEAEDKLWQLLRNNKLGIKFRRQHPIGAYIADFISLKNNLIVEVDGGYHETEEQKVYDENRTKVLKEIGFKVVRFSNKEILENVFAVRDKIKEFVAASPLSIHGEGLGVRETNTMPGYAGSSWYFLRYMDPQNDKEFCSKKISDYWNQVDLYVGGTEHAVGHLLYSRMWTKALYDLGLISFDEPFKKLLNQGMIQGSSRFVFRFEITEGLIDIKDNREKTKFSLFVSHKYFNDPTNYVSELIEKIKSNFPKYPYLNILEANRSFKLSPLHVDVKIVDGVELDIEAFRKSKPEYKNAVFILEDGSVNTPLSTRGEGQGVRYICGTEVEKMSKSKFNTVNPNEIVEKYGADTFRMYEMFLGPIDQSKPWDTKGIEGVHRFLKKLWRLFFDETGAIWTTAAPSPSERAGGEATNEELKILHKTIKKIVEDTERFSFNTAVSAFMICVNELTDLKCHKKEILEPLLILLQPYAPHIAEELYQELSSSKVSPPVCGGDSEGASILNATFPNFEEKYLIETTKEYPVSINGKLRTQITLDLDATQQQVQEVILSHPVVQKWMDRKPLKKFIFVKGKMINVVV